MPAKDIIHNEVKNALIKDGWNITDDPYIIDYKELTLFADLGAEQPIGAEFQGRKIVVEIKSFNAPPYFQEFKEAYGQYCIYRDLLALTDPERELYLAIRDNVYKTFFKQEAIQRLVNNAQMRLLIIKIVAEEIVAWIN